jgi:hypothetical protein
LRAFRPKPFSRAQAQGWQIPPKLPLFVRKNKIILRKVKVALVSNQYSDEYGAGQGYPQELLAKLWELKHPNVDKMDIPSKEQVRDVVLQFLDAKFSVDNLNHHMIEIFLKMSNHTSRVIFKAYLRARSGVDVGPSFWGEYTLAPGHIRAFVDNVAKPDKLASARALLKNILVLRSFGHLSKDIAKLSELMFEYDEFKDWDFEREKLEIPFVMPEVVDIITDCVYETCAQNLYFVRDGCGWNIDGEGEYAFDRSDPLLIEALTQLPDQGWYDVYTVWGPWKIDYSSYYEDNYSEVIGCIVHETGDEGEMRYTNVLPDWPSQEWMAKWIHPGTSSKKVEDPDSIPATKSGMENVIWNWVSANSTHVQLHRTNFWEDNAGYRYKVPFEFANSKEDRYSLGEGALDFVAADYAAYHAAMANSANRYDEDKLLLEAEAYLAGQPMTTEPYESLEERISRIDFDA